VSPFPFGERYFTRRERISRLMRAIDELATQVGSPLSEQLPLLGEPADDDHAFLFAACGEVNSGKSAFLNGLLGIPDLCPVSDLAQSQPIRHYSYGERDHDEQWSDNLELCTRRIELLRNFHLVDTPGIKSDTDEYPVELIKLLSKADIICCLLPVSNPWSPATWNFLLQLAPEFHSRICLVIQQIDERESIDIKIIEGHVRELASKKLDFSPPIFSVSAKQALNGERQSYQLLSSHIERHIEKLDSRNTQLRQWLDQALAALNEIEDRVEGHAGQLREQDRFINEIETEIEQMRESFIQKLPHHLIDVAENFETEGLWTSKLLHRRLGAFRSIVRVFVGDRTAASIEKAFIEHIQAVVEKIAERDSGKVVHCCEEHWQELEIRIEQSMGIRPTTDQPIEQSLQASRDHFISRLRQATELGINNLKVRHLLDKEFRARNVALKSFTAATLIFTLLASICGILNLAWAPWILLGIAGIFTGVGVLSAWVTRRHIVRDFKEHILRTCGAFARTLESDFEKALQEVFRDYADSLAHVREHFAQEKMSIEPRQRKWQKCFLTLKTLEQEI